LAAAGFTIMMTSPFTTVSIGARRKMYIGALTSAETVPLTECWSPWDRDAYVPSLERQVDVGQEDQPDQDEHKPVHFRPSEQDSEEDEYCSDHAYGREGWIDESGDEA
jgi:hypothetical protein